MSLALGLEGSDLGESARELLLCLCELLLELRDIVLPPGTMTALIFAYARECMFGRYTCAAGAIGGERRR